METPGNAKAEGRGSVTERLARGAARHLTGLGAGVVPQFPLPNGRRLDLLALLPDGRLWAVEVISGVDDVLAERKWQDPVDWCDALYFCVDPTFPLALVPDQVGVLVADSFGAQMMRAAPAHALPPGRRQVMTLRFAGLAARGPAETP